MDNLVTQEQCDARTRRFEDHLEEHNKRFREFIEKFEHWRGTQEQMLMTLTRIANKHDETIPPIQMKVDRLEVIESGRKWTIRAIWAAILTTAAKVLADAIGK